MKRIYDHEEMIRLYHEGYTDKQIADELGCNVDYVKNIRIKYKLPINPEEFDEGKMMALYRAGGGIHKIADEMGVEDEEIERRLRDVTRQH